MTTSKRNNTVHKRIYHRKWNTEENQVYHHQLNTICGIDNSKIPIAWAREIYELIREIQQKYPQVEIFSIKEKDCELKLYYSFGPNEEKNEANGWVNSRIAHAVIVLILKNAYAFSERDISKNRQVDYFNFSGAKLYETFKALKTMEILDYKQREPVYKDALLLEENLTEAEVKAAQSFLNDKIPEWQDVLDHSGTSRLNPQNIHNPRLQIMLQLASKYSMFSKNSIESSEEILSIDKFSEKRTRALFENDILLQLTLKLYSQGDRESIKKLQSGQWDKNLRQLEDRLMREKEKNVLIENIVAYFKVKSQNGVLNPLL